MKRKYLLDTNVVIDHVAGRRKLPERVSRSEAMLVSQVTVGEIKAGLDSTHRGARERRTMDAFLSLDNVVRVTLTDATAELYAKVFRQLKKDGRPIPLNDVWIAAQALEHGAAVVSSDRHFSFVENLLSETVEDL